MKHKRRQQPVTRREVLRIVQAARDDILHAIVMADPHVWDKSVPLDEHWLWHGSTTPGQVYVPLEENTA